MDPFIKMTFTQCLVNGLMLLIGFTNWDNLSELLVLKFVLPFILDTDLFSKNILHVFHSLRFINLVAEP